MSSIKDIIVMDVEPLESQAYRSRKAAQQQASHHSSTSSASETPSQPLDLVQSVEEIRSTHQRRSSRTLQTDVSYAASLPSSSAPSSRLPPVRGPESASREEMDFQNSFRMGDSRQPTSSASPRLTTRGTKSSTESSIKYTPVTGRISKAKKGVPVHTCGICRPVKTFTRAEHLRSASSEMIMWKITNECVDDIN